MKIFNIDSVSTDNAIDKINTDLKPFVSVVNASRGCLGGDDTIMLLVALNPKSEWKLGIPENSQYFRMHIESNGVVECFTQSIYKNNIISYENRIKTKFRKYTAKSVDDLIQKIKTFIEKINVELLS